MTLLGHVCVPLDPGHAVTRAGLSVAGVPGDAAPPASCEALPGSSVTCPGFLAVASRVQTSEVPSAEAADVRDTPAPIPRPPRFLLHAALLN